jgi:Leucine-rich repeat (LRR) protein
MSQTYITYAETNLTKLPDLSYLENIKMLDLSDNKLTKW